MNRLFLKRLCSTAILFSLTPFLWAQQTPSPTVDQTMRSHDKIYVVMAVCIVILVAFFLYLIRIDRKISKKEKSL
jgi:hypothetical protein